jgi:hypothetical protein
MNVSVSRAWVAEAERAMSALAGVADPEAFVKAAREALAVAVENLDTLSQANSKAVCRRALAMLGGEK